MSKVSKHYLLGEFRDGRRSQHLSRILVIKLSSSLLLSFRSSDAACSILREELVAKLLESLASDSPVSLAVSEALFG
jgi:hypothetical protein